MANKKRLIDANAIPESATAISTKGRLFVAWSAIVEAPTVDAVEVVHGEWIYHECVSSHDGAISGYSCSKCNAFVNEDIFDMDEFHKDFCGHCGAKMDG